MSTRSSLEKAFSQKVRKKKTTGEGKDFGKGEAVGGVRAAVGESEGGAYMSAKERIREKDRAKMKQMIAERDEILRDQEKTKAQEKKNRNAILSIRREMANPEGPDRGAMMDFAQDYIPLDDQYGKAADRERIRKAFRQRRR